MMYLLSLCDQALKVDICQTRDGIEGNEMLQ